MKTHIIIIIITALTAGIGSSSVVQGAISNEEAHSMRQESHPAEPVPVTVVKPIVGLEHVGSIVELIFTVDKHGWPRGIRSLSNASDALVSRIVYAVSRWKFEPARDRDGNPRAVQVRLPVEIVDPAPKSHGLRVSR